MPSFDRFEGPLFWVGLLLVWNLIVFLRYGWDKLAAIQGYWRVSEAELLLLGFLGGALGAKVAQRVFRHKTSKQPFAQNLNIVVGLQAVLVFCAAVFPEPMMHTVSTVGVWLAPENVEPDRSPVVKVNRGL